MARTPLLPTGSNQAAEDRRRRNRVSGEAQGWILPASRKLAKHTPTDEEAWEVRIHDVSRFGVGFSSTEPMHLGDEHRLRIGRGPMKRARLIRIVACRRADSASYTVGAEFIDTANRPFSKAG